MITSGYTLWITHPVSGKCLAMDRTPAARLDMGGHRLRILAIFPHFRQSQTTDRTFREPGLHDT